MPNDYTPTELAQANRLEGYLAGLERRQIVPSDATHEDIALYRTARNFATMRVQPSTLTAPLPKRFNLRTLGLWLSPLPLIAAATVIYIISSQPANKIDDLQLANVQIDLAAIEQSNNDLLAMEQELDKSLAEIDLLTSTDYIDQL